MLHKEFAIDPGQLNSIADIRYLNARFGYDKGALISAFPKQWYRDVASRFENLSSDHQPDILSEVLPHLKSNAIVRFSREYQSETWVESAMASHERKPFHRIVEPSLTKSGSRVMVPNLYELGCDDFSVETGLTRTSESLADAAKGLLFNAEKVTLVDPYLCISKTSYQKTLLALMNRCKKNRVRFWIFSEDDRNKDWELIQPDLIKFQTKIPDHIELSWFRLSDDGNGFLHSRGLFTAKGGLIYDRGFGEPSDH